MLVVKVIYYLELVDLLPIDDLAAGTVDSTGVDLQFMDWGWFRVNLGCVGEGLILLVNMWEFGVNVGWVGEEFSRVNPKFGVNSCWLGEEFRVNLG